MHSVSIIGCGYAGSRLAERWLNLKHIVRGFAMRPESLRRIAETGATPVQLDLDQPAAEAIDFANQVLYYAAPAQPQGAGDERLERCLEHIAVPPRRFVYLSTTGVYGDHDGRLVNEDTPPTPRTERAIRRLAAENALRAWADSHAVPWCILRVAGIYGPGRLPLDRLRRQEPAIPSPGGDTRQPDSRGRPGHGVPRRPGRVQPAEGRIYNVCDGNDDSMTAYLQRVARIGELPPPPLVGRSVAQAVFSTTAWSFASESRRIDNRRMLQELGVTLAYADLDAGIRASLAR